MKSANFLYRDLLYLLALHEQRVSPRDQATQEMLGFQSVVDMQFPIVTMPSRKLNYKFMAAEAYWILSGLQDLSEITPYCGRMKDFSDDGRTLSGAYGPRFVTQVRYIVDAITWDPQTRQAVMTIWERSPRPSKDIPCTVSLQWLIRENKIHCIANMRSSDAWLGWPYDVFTFTMMTAYIRLALGSTYALGNLRLFAGSQHLYGRDREAAKAVIDTATTESDGQIWPITLHGLLTPDDLMASLGDIRNTSNDNVLTHIQQQLCRS